MSVSRLLGGLRSQRARLGASAVVAAVAGAGGAGLTVAFVTATPQPIVHAAAATPADPSCGGLITVICASESHGGDTNGGTNSNNGDQRSGGGDASQSVSQGNGSSHGSKAHHGDHDEGDPEVTGCH
jgi:hypothetical protein